MTSQGQPRVAKVPGGRLPPLKYPGVECGTIRKAAEKKAKAAEQKAEREREARLAVEAELAKIREELAKAKGRM